MVLIRLQCLCMASKSVDNAILLFQDGGLQITGTLNGSSRLVEVLKQENFSLKKELETYYQKVRKLLKVQWKKEWDMYLGTGPA